MANKNYPSFAFKLILILGCWVGMWNMSIAQSQWMGLGPYTTGAIPEKRHENAFVQFGDKMYLIGGRETTGVQEYDPVTNTWTNKAASPEAMHHMQPVVALNKIYILGAASNEQGFPNEPPHTNVWIYDPVADFWEEGVEIPVDRNKGSAGVVAYNDKIYMICGSVRAHDNDGSSLFTEYDPATNTFTPYPDAPNARDHVQAAIVGDLLVMAGGRQTPVDAFFVLNTVEEVDVYDMTQGPNGTWTTLPAASNIPTPRAAAGVAVVGNEAIYIGGESIVFDENTRIPHGEVEALDVNTGTWRSLSPLNTPRHASQATLFDGQIYIAAGSKSIGGDVIVDPSEEFFVETLSVGVGQTAPRALISATPTLGDAPLTVAFDGSGSTDADGNVVSFAWDFGDGGSSTEPSPSYTYTEVGVYTVTLVVTDNDGLTNTATTVINVTVPGGLRVLLVGESNSGDLAIQQRLTSSGASVDIIGGAAAQTADAGNYDIVLISSSVVSTEVGTKFTNVAVPVINWEPFLYDDLQMTGAAADTDFGIIPQNQMNIVLPDHPLAGGFTGTVTLTNAVTDMSWGAPSENGIVVGVNPDIPAQSFLFGYETGAEMVGINAPARRVGIFLMDSTANLLTEQGFTLLTNAVSWASADPTLLPIEWGHFTVEVVNNRVLLDWSTNTEENSSHFVIHRGNRLGYFSPLAELPTSHNSSRARYYSFTDSLPSSGINYYRLQHVDIDGSYSFSPIVSAYIETVSPQVYPNPVSTEQSLFIRGETVGQLNVKLVDMQGRMVRQASWTDNGNTTHEMDIEGLAPGLYVAVIESANKVYSRKVLVE